MNARSLQEDLLSIPGVEGAEVEGTADKPAGLRIRIAEGADQAAVGGAIRRVLTTHGLGTDTRLPGESPVEDTEPDVAAEMPASVPEEIVEDVAPATATEEAPSTVAVMEEEPGAVIDLTERDGGAGNGASAAAESDSTASPGAMVDPADAAEPVVPEPTAARPVVVSEAAPDVASVAEPQEPRATPGVVARISSVSVEEGRGGITVTVTASDGTKVRQPAASNEGGVEAAVIQAAAHLARPSSPDARVVDVDDRRIEGVDIVMIVLDTDGEMVAGSAVVGAGRSFALGRATWAALNH